MMAHTDNVIMPLCQKGKSVQILNGKKIADDIAGGLIGRVQQLKSSGITPKLAIVMIEPDARSEVYVRMKARRANQLGIAIEKILLRESSQANYADAISKIATRDDTHGIILQLPIPDVLDTQALIDCIPPQKDVDGLGTGNQALFESRQPTFWPATPLGVMRLLAEYQIEVEGKIVTVIGRSKLVGYPLACLLSQRGARVQVGHSQTGDLAKLTLDSDIIISATGVAGLVTGAMISPGTVVVDIGTSERAGKIVGDVDFDSVAPKASYITPVPGGVGPMTVIMLMQNVIDAAERQSTNYTSSRTPV